MADIAGVYTYAFIEKFFHEMRIWPKSWPIYPGKS